MVAGNILTPCSPSPHPASHISAFRSPYIMRPTSPAHSGMPTGKKYMGWWGAFGGPQQKGISQYSVSSNQQAAMRGALRQYLFYGYKRIMANAPYFGIPFGIGYAVYSWGVSRNHYLNSKAGHLEFGEHEE
ncbi:unnamed protein product [Parajaminaea phylloscopi]